MKLHQLYEHPVEFHYHKLNAAAINKLKEGSEVCEVAPRPGLIVDNCYYKMGYAGTLPRMYARKAVYQRLCEAADFLAPHYGLFIYDVFRSIGTQTSLFHEFHDFIKEKYPKFSQAELDIETRKYVSHPNEPSRFAVPPHNSGGAVDLAIYDRKTNQLLDFGGHFDQLDSVSDTDFYEHHYNPKFGISEEKWLHSRESRRILFHTMKHFGFTNFQSEWWHYDLGDCMWAAEHHTDYIFDSMETAVEDLHAKLAAKLSDSSTA